MSKQNELTVEKMICIEIKIRRKNIATVNRRNEIFTMSIFQENLYLIFMVEEKNILSFETH